MAIYASGVVGIYNVVTLPGARGRGIRRSVTLASLLEARARGYRVAVLHSTGDGGLRLPAPGLQAILHDTTLLLVGQTSVWRRFYPTTL